MMATAHLPDDPGVRLLGIQISAKRVEQAARRALGDSMAGPSTLVPNFFRTWEAAKYSEWRVHRAIRCSCRRTVIPMVRKAIS